MDRLNGVRRQGMMTILGVRRWVVVLATSAVTGLGTGAGGCTVFACSEGGRIYANGESWTCADGCNDCSCHNGATSKTAMSCDHEPGPDAGMRYCVGPGWLFRHGESWTCEDDCTCRCDDGSVVTEASCWSASQGGGSSSSVGAGQEDGSSHTAGASQGGSSNHAASAGSGPAGTPSSGTAPAFP